MVHFQCLVLGLSIAGTCSAYAFNQPAKISLYEPSNFTEVSSDCGVGTESNDIRLPINTCLWGDYALINNLKITRLPTCANGAFPSLSFYSTTSCTGNPTYTSTSPPTSEKCLFASSTAQWSMVFRCEKLDSQAIASGKYQQAIPPNHEEYKKSTPRVSHGVVTPHSSSDCTIWQPKEPTFLPPDTCLTLDAKGTNSGRSIFINQPAICANGKAALFESFSEPGCAGEDSPSTDSAVLDKKCYASRVRSIRFLCGDGAMAMFEDLPAHVHKDVEPLHISSPAPSYAPTKYTPRPDQTTIASSQKPAGYLSSTSSKKLNAETKHFQIKGKLTQNLEIAVLEIEGDVPRPVKTALVQGKRILPADAESSGRVRENAWVTTPAKSHRIPTQVTRKVETRPSTDQAVPVIPVISLDDPSISHHRKPTTFGTASQTPCAQDGYLQPYTLFIIILLVLAIGVSVASCCLTGTAMLRREREGAIRL